MIKSAGNRGYSAKIRQIRLLERLNLLVVVDTSDIVVV